MLDQALTAKTFTIDQFGAMFPGVSDEWAKAFATACPEFEITTPERLAAFFANVSHESLGLTRLEESFAYTPKRLRQVFPKYFKKPSDAETYVHLGAKAIANRVYANRMGNGSETSGDGWRYRGQGPPMLTGSANYIRVGKALNLPLWSKPELARTPAGGARIAGFFWQDAKCNSFIDAGDFDGVCDKFNIGRKTFLIGDSNGYADRVAIWHRFRAIFNLPALRAAVAAA